MTNPLDRFVPRPEARERHSIIVRAPSSYVFEAAQAFDFQAVPVIRAIIRLRQRLLGSAPVDRQPRPFLQEIRAMGWGTLVDEPGRLFVAGAICQPWLADVHFKPLPPDTFAAHHEANHVKIAWTLELEPLSPTSTRLSTETRAAGTDAAAQRRFRGYWRWARFGIVTIRWFMLPAIRRRAEAAWRAQSDR